MLPSKDIIKQVKYLFQKITQSNELNFTYLSDGEKDKKECMQTRKLLQEFNGKKKIEISLKSILTISSQVLEKIEDKLEVFKEIFLSYAKLGDKLNFNKITYTGFLKFLKDCNLIHYKKLDSNEISSNQVLNSFSSRQSLSPLRIIISSPSQNSLKNSQRAHNSYLIKGRLIESEAFCIFCSLTGHQNFDNSIKIKNHFNLNKGFTHKLGETIINNSMSQSKLLTTRKSNVPMKMDFNLFIKSFETISKKIYPKLGLDDGVINFLENVIIKI